MRRNTLGDDGGGGIFANMDHLGARIGLLQVVGDGDGIKFTHGIVAL